MFKRIIYSSLNGHIFVTFQIFCNCSQQGLSFSVNISLPTFIARRSLLSDLGSDELGVGWGEGGLLTHAHWQPNLIVVELEQY